jgi:hypothetical protein
MKLTVFSIMAPGVWISFVTLLVGYFVCLSESHIENNTSVSNWNSVNITQINHNNDTYKKLGISPHLLSLDDVLTNSSSDHETEHHGIHVASWRWDEIGVFCTFAIFIVVSGLAKVGKFPAFLGVELCPFVCISFQ